MAVLMSACLQATWAQLFVPQLPADKGNRPFDAKRDVLEEMVVK